jgi:hypothetical protein
MPDTVKVGYWKGSFKTLRSRYITTYGKDLQIDVFGTPAPSQVEALFKKVFSDAKMECELYDTRHIDSYKSWLNEACELSKRGMCVMPMDMQ